VLGDFEREVGQRLRLRIGVWLLDVVRFAGKRTLMSGHDVVAKK
jgi:hypothetical protein